jgi:hypothetical protein
MEDFLALARIHLDQISNATRSKNRVIFGITGGVDSRAIFCNFVANCVPFEGVTWIGHYIKPAEHAVVEALVDVCEIDHRYVYPRTPARPEIADAANEASGLFRGPSRLVAAMSRYYTGATFVKGHGGEIMRGFYNLRKSRMPDLSPHSMASAYGGPYGSARELAREMFTEFTVRAEYSTVPSSYDPNDIFYWEHRMGMWGAPALNEMDLVMNSIIGFNSRPLFAAAFGLPPEQRLTKELLEKVVAVHSSTLAAIPYA